MTVQAGWPDGVRLQRYGVVDSTNAEAIRQAQGGERGPLWIVAARQTAGRGRLGRVWVSRPGNLFASLLLECPGSRAPQAGFLVGISAAEVVSAYVAAERVTLKWPNDILIDRRKCAGILVERASDSTVAAGIGIDLAHAPAECAAVSLQSVSGIAPDSDIVLNGLANHMNAWLSVWRTAGFAPVREAWLQRATGAGEFIRASTPQGTIEGVFQEIDQDGALLLRDSGGLCHRITAADVWYGS